jgi:hypothetical protein
MRLAADGLFAGAVTLTGGANQIEVFARAGDGAAKRASVIVYYQPGTQRSLDLELFWKKRKNSRSRLSGWKSSRRKIRSKWSASGSNASKGRRWRRILCHDELRKRPTLQAERYFLTLSTSAAIAISDAPARLIIDITRTVSPNNTSLSPRRITIFSELAARASLRAGSRVSSVTFF